MKATTIILCGGRERRFGGNKALAVVGGRKVLDRVIERLEPISSEILLVTSPEKTGLPAKPSARILIDKYPGKGPLGGIYTGIFEASCPYAVVVGCDMPFLNAKLLGRMMEISEGFDAVIPRLDRGMIEPLHAVYARSCAEEIKARLEKDRLSITQLIRELKVRYLDKEEYLPLDPQMLSFFNINYRADLQRANELSAEVDLSLAGHEQSSARVRPRLREP